MYGSMAETRSPEVVASPSRLLNVLPATRITATAVDAFLSVGGFRLYSLYGRQFVKMLHYIDQVFLEDLKKVRRRRRRCRPDTRGDAAPQ